MHASTGIDRYMHEFENRPTAGSSDCPGCARQGPPPGRTRGLPYPGRSGRPSHGRVGCVGSLGTRGLSAASGSVLHRIPKDRAGRLKGRDDGRGCGSRRGQGESRAEVSPPYRRNAEKELPVRMAGRVQDGRGGRPAAGLRVLQKESCTIRNKPGLVARPLRPADDRPRGRRRRAIITARAFTAAGRFSPLGPVGIRAPL